MLCLDFTLLEEIQLGGSPKSTYILFYGTKIGANTERKEISKEEFERYQSLITKYPRSEMDIDGDNIKELVYQCTLNQILSGSLPPVEVVAKPHTKKITSTLKILGFPIWFVFLGIAGCILFITDNVKKVRKR